MSIAPISNTGQTTSTSSTSGGLKADSNTFMKLLVANLSHQDPMQPQDSSSYMQQLSSMTMVEQMTSVADTTKAAAETQNANAVIGLIGKTVSYITADGTTKTGQVTRAEIAGERPTITVGEDEGIDPSLITRVS